MSKITILLALILSLPAWSQTVSPPHQARTTSVRPTISADLNTTTRGARIWVDGTEFTQYMRKQGDTVTLVPPYNLDYGVHQVQVLAPNGRQLAWNFAIVNNQAYNYRYNNNQTYYPSNNQTYYPNNSPYNYPNDTTYYPSNNDGRYYPDDDVSSGIEDLLPLILPRLLPNRY